MKSKKDKNEPFWEDNDDEETWYGCAVIPEDAPRDFDDAEFCHQCALEKRADKCRKFRKKNGTTKFRVERFTESYYYYYYE